MKTTPAERAAQSQANLRDRTETLTVHRVLQRALGIALAAPDTLVSDVISWHGHIPFAQALVAIAQPRLFVELGVHKGDSYLAMVDAMSRYSVEGRALAIDSWLGDDHAGRYDGDAILSELARRNAPFAGFSRLMRKTFDEAVHDFDDGTIDLLHIDGLHTYEAVRHDFESWQPKLSDRSIVLFHDVTVRGDDFGVYRYWEEISAGRLSLTFPHSNGLGVLWTGGNNISEVRELIELLGKSKESGISPLTLFTAIGDAFAGRIATRVLSKMYYAKDAEAQGIQSASLAEIERLNAEIIAIRREGQGALDHLHAQEAELREGLARATGDTFRLQEENSALDKAIVESRTAYAEASVALRRAVDRRDALAGELKAAENLREHAAAEAEALRAALTDGRQSQAACANATVKEELANALERMEILFGELAAAEERRVDVETRAAAEQETLRTALTESRAAHAAAIAELEARRRNSLGGVIRNAMAPLRQGSLKLARTAGRTAFTMLPLPQDTRTRLKYRLITRFGGLLGVGVGHRTYDISNSAQVALQYHSERYLDIARTATGKPSNLPGRSVSIIIPVYNQIEYTLRCIASVARNSTEIEYQIIVVDDCSSDETPSELSRRRDIVFIRNRQNLGFIGSCNAGLARATKNYVVYLNNDTEVGPGWLSALVNTFELNDNVGLVGSKLIYPDGRLQEAGGIIWDDFSGWNWGRMQDPEDPRYNYVRHADYCSGAALMLPRSLANALGGFDPHFTPAYGEDSDLAFKIRSLGLSVLYQPLSQVIHYEGISSGTDVTKGVKAYQVANAEKLAKRWAPVLSHQGPNGVNADIVTDRGRLGRILVIDQITPQPDHDAGSITALELMRALRDFGYKITFTPCSNFTNIPNYTDTLAALGIESVLYPWTGTVREHLERVGRHYDAVVIFRLNSACEHIETVRELAPQAKLIFHTSDLHFLREERAQQIDNPNIPEQRGAASQTKAAELDIIGKSSLTIVHSLFERDLLAQIAPDKPVVVFPWIYEPRGAGNSPRKRDDLVFLGGYRHYPNVDAVSYFAKEVLPILLPRNPDLVFHAVGSNPPPEMAQLATPNLRIDGFIEDISPVLWGARMMVAPLRYGAGLKGKIVTAMAHGLPVITTSVGAEGMGLADGVDVLVADEPESMAAAIERLNSDDELWNSLSKAGLDYVARTTSRRVGYAIVRDILDKLGLPHVARNLHLTSEHQYCGAFGSPDALFDARKLLAAAADGKPTGGLLLVPPALRDTRVDGWRVEPAAQAGAPADRVVAIVDSTSDAQVVEVARVLPRVVAEGGSATIVFAPPRLVATADGYCVRQPFQDVDLATTIQPVQERHQKHLSVLGGTVGWRADATMLGFPAMMMADWRP
ncbi:glycosyltransferase [Mesorhizobium caraganae]|uniref:glycosyltransferase n=1 Tax=Mesorhizobium caraganae TaxID=483206 RepID=UPI00333796D1